MIGPDGKGVSGNAAINRAMSLLRRVTSRLDREVERRTDFDEATRVTLTPEGQDSPREWVLISYILEPFLLPSWDQVSNAHTNQWESLQMARTFLELGFGVDVISYRNRTFVPKRDYRLFIGARTNFERLAGQLPDSCIKVAHLDTAHWMTNNANAYRRVLGIKERRGIAVDLPRKVVEPNWALEAAHYGTVLGNEFTAASYGYAGKPIFRLPLPSAQTFDWPEGKSFAEARRRFVWFGSDGLVHKGLNLALEAFAQLPELELYVCGPIDEEPRFREAFRRELFELPNIHTVGWVDIAGEEFRRVVSECAFLLYPSSAEGGGGSVITAMQAGLIPVVTREASVDVAPGFGMELAQDSLDSIMRCARDLAARPAPELEAMARRAREVAREFYTRERYSREFRQLMEKLLELGPQPGGEVVEEARAQRAALAAATRAPRDQELIDQP